MVIYGQDEREMWLEMVKRIYANEWAAGNAGCPAKAAIAGADKFIEVMKDRQKQEDGE